MTGSNNNNRRRRRERRGSSRRSSSNCGKGAARQALKKYLHSFIWKANTQIKYTRKYTTKKRRKPETKCGQKYSTCSGCCSCSCCSWHCSPPAQAAKNNCSTKLAHSLRPLVVSSHPLVPAPSTCRCSRFAYTGNEHDAATSQFGFTSLWSPPEQAQQATGRAPSPRGKQGKEALCGAWVSRLKREMLKRRRRWTLVSSFLPFYVCPF